RLMHLPVLREAIALAPLASVAVPVRAVVPLQVRGTHALPWAQLPEHHPRLDRRHPTPLARLVDRGVAHPLRRQHTRASGPGRPVRRGTRSSPKTDNSTSAYTGYSSLMTNSGTRPPSRSRTLPSSTSALSWVRGPTTTSNTRRLSGSRATWSHWSPLNQSASS